MQKPKRHTPDLFSVHMPRALVRERAATGEPGQRSTDPVAVRASRVKPRYYVPSFLLSLYPSLHMALTVLSMC